MVSRSPTTAWFQGPSSPITAWFQGPNSPITAYGFKVATHRSLHGFKIPTHGVFSKYLLTYYGRFKVDEDGSRHVLSGASLTEEGVERVIATTDGLVAGHLAIRLDSVLQAIQLPAGVTDLDTGLSDVYGDTFTL